MLGRADDEDEIEAQNTDALLSNAEEDSNNSDGISFWIKAGFLKDFVITFLGTATSNATLITYLADLPPWKFGIGLVAAEVSCPMAVFFALCEAYAHLQQNKTFTATEANNNLGESDIKFSDVPLTKKQIAAAIMHYCSDVLSDTAIPLLLMQTLSLESSLPAVQAALNPRWVKSAIGLGALLFNAVGDYQDLKNTITAGKENNLREMVQGRQMKIR